MDVRLPAILLLTRDVRTERFANYPVKSSKPPPPDWTLPPMKSESFLLLTVGQSVRPLLTARFLPLSVESYCLDCPWSDGRLALFQIYVICCLLSGS